MLPLSASAKGMVSPSKPATHSRVASHQQSAKLKLVKGLRPLANYRFYLDIEKHHVSSKIDRQIKELGGSIEFFLVKEVTHFVTDKPTIATHHSQEHLPPGTPTKNAATTSSTDVYGTPRTPKTPYTPSYLNDPFDVQSPHAATETRNPAPKPRSRADAMLQRARRTTHTLTAEPLHSNSSHTQPQNALLQNKHLQLQRSVEPTGSQHSPVQLAKSWGTPIWTTDNTLRFLAKVAAALKHDASHHSTTPTRTGGAPSNTTTPSASAVRHSLGGGGGIGSPRPRAANTKRLKGDYIKVEAVDRNYRPYYKEFHGWPTINLQLDAGYCPFWQVAPFAEEPQRKPPPAIVGRNAPQPQPSPHPVPSAMTRKSRSKSNRPTNVAPNHHHQTATAEQPTASSKPAIVESSVAAAAAAAPATNTELKCGYCEICHIEYDVLATHLQSVEHLKFVCNNDNFITLDAMIGSGASMDTFLARQQQNGDGDDAASADQDDPMKIEDPLLLTADDVVPMEEEHVFGKRSAGKKSVKPFRANGRSSGGNADIKRSTEDRVEIGVVAEPRINGNAVTRPAKVPKMSTKRRTTSGSTKKEVPSPTMVPLLERSSKVAAKVAVAAVVAVETADDDDDDDDADLMNIRSNHAKVAYTNGGVNSVYDKAVRFCNVPPVSSGSVAASAAADDDQPNRVRARRESAKRINYDETKEDDDSPKKMPPNNGSHSSSTVTAAAIDSAAATGSQLAKDNSKTNRKIKKIRLRSIRWRAPSDEERRSTMSQPFYKVVEDGAVGKAVSATVADDALQTVSTETTCDSASTPSHPPGTVETSAAKTTETTGLKLRVCRVRNSELSALTNEADKFMFPRLSSSDVLTDEDRHTTSEFGAADMSADVVSSSEHDRSAAATAIIHQQQQPESKRRRSRAESSGSTASAKTTATGATTAATSTAALDASNKRKRRKQLEAFLNDNSEYYKFDNLDSRLRFQEAPFQPNLGNDVGSSSGIISGGGSCSTAPPPSAADAVQTRTSPCTTPTKLAKRAMLAGTSPSARQTRSAQQQQQQQHQPPASPRTPTRASRRPYREADDGKGAFGTPTRAQSTLTPTNTNIMAAVTISTDISADAMSPQATTLPVLPLSQMSPTTLARTDVTGALLKMDVVQMHTFAFERVPSQEPWYEVFQRQDECRERIFEYWGSTAYRKLPYELGPLPPHPPDCCPLAKLTPAKRPPRQSKAAAKKPATATAKRATGSRQTAAAQASPCQTRPPSSASNSGGGTVPNTTSSTGSSSGLDRLHDIRVQKRLLKLHKNLEVNVLPNHHSTAAPPPSANSRTATLLATATSLEVRMHKRNIPISQRQQQLLAGSSGCDEMRALSEGRVKMDKSDPFLLDINGRPRKSPREHASTLAILSCLVQQRRKREKELNGGISPQKLRSPQQTQRRNRSVGIHRETTTESEYDPDSEDDDLQQAAADDYLMADAASSLKADDEAATTVSSSERRDAKSIKMECDSDAEPMDIPADPPPTPPPDDGSVAKAVAKASAKPAANVYPPMPDLHYVSPYQVCRQIDDMFAASERDADQAGFLADMELTASSDCVARAAAVADDYDDLVLIGTRKDFVDIVHSVAAGPLRYHRYHKRSSGARHRSSRTSLTAAAAQTASTSLAVSRKRRNNRTGWPTIPRRRPTATVTTAVAAVAEEEVEEEKVAAGETRPIDEQAPNLDTHPKEETIEDDHTEVADDAEESGEVDERAQPESVCAEDETTCSTALTAPVTERDEEDDPDTEADEQDSMVEEEDADAEEAEDEEREQEDELDNAEQMSTEAEEDDGDAIATHPIDGAEHTDEDHAERTASVVAFASHSEKAENSDIFTVSSDSVDSVVVAVPPAPTVCEVSPLVKCSTTAMSPSPDLDGNADTPAEEDPDADPDADASSDAEPSLAVIRSQPSYTASPQVRQHNDNRSEQAVTATTPTIRSTPGRRKVGAYSATQRVHSIATGSSASLSSSKSSSPLFPALQHPSSSQLDNSNSTAPQQPSAAVEHRRLMLQPVVRMKKIQMMPSMSAASRRRSVRSEERLAATAATAAGDDCGGDGEGNGVVAGGGESVLMATSARTPPKEQFSPPKLRKPRGRWYRER